MKKEVHFGKQSTPASKNYRIPLLYRISYQDEKISFMKTKRTINDNDPNRDNSRIETDKPEENITSEEIEQSEISQNKFEKQRGESSFEGVSNTTIDSSPERKGNIGVNQSSLSDYEKQKFNKDAENIEGDGDSGSGRSSGADRA